MMLEEAAQLAMAAMHSAVNEEGQIAVIVEVIAQARAEAIEQCARVAEEMSGRGCGDLAARNVAAAIRSLAEQKE